MSAPIVITDPMTGKAAMVSKFGQLITSPIDYSTPFTAAMSSSNTPYLLVSPIGGKSIVITTLILTANKSVGANDATVSIYTTDTIDGALTSTPEVQLEMIKKSSLPLTGLNLIIPEGKFLFAQTDDNTVYATIGYYRVPV